MTPGTIIDGRFEIERATGAGGMGVVFRAFDRLEGVPVAVKLLHGENPTEVERFEREGAILAELSHPAIVRYITRGVRPSGERYLVMEWLEGEDLGERLARSQLTPAESLGVVREASAALAVAHARGIMHRDIKPGNIFLLGGRVSAVRLLDFGIARLLDETSPITLSGALVGTPGYIAPEQALGAPVRDPSADVFALGCVLFECLTGRRAFEGVNFMAVLAKILLQEIPLLRSIRPDLPEPLERLVSSMMARQVALRLRDAAEVVRAIDALEIDRFAPPPTPARSLAAGPSSAPGRAPRIALTLSEQRIVTVVLAAAPVEEGAPSGPGAVGLARAEREVERQGGRLDVLAGGAMLVTIWGAGSAVDRAGRACRSALHLLGTIPGARVVAVTGRGVVSAQVVEGSVLDRAAEALQGARTGVVQLDAATAEMLDARFLVDDDHALLREQGRLDAAPLLLGKPTPFVGRSRELSLLEAMFAGCVDEATASAVLVTGEAGTGKSRLFQELLTRIRRGGVAAEEIAGRADALGDFSPFGILGDAIRGAADIHEGEPVEDRRRKLVARLGRHLEGVSLARASAFLGEMAGTPFPDDAAAPLRAARVNAQIMGDMMRSAWETWLAAECAARPVVLRVEDLHWGDAATVRLVDATLRNLRDLPLLVLASARPEVHGRFPTLWAERAVHALALGPLPRNAGERLVRGALGESAAPSMVDRVVQRADGNPFYLEELVRAVAAGRADVFPESVLGMVEARLDAEGPEAKRALRAASVFGARFSARGVSALLGGHGHLGAVRGRLERLAARELVTAPAGLAEEALYGFGHALVREAAYATLTEEDRALGHRLAAEWLEAGGASDAVSLAEHFLRGGEPLRAVRWYRRAAEQALAADDLDATIERVARGVASGAAGEELGALLLVEAEARLWLGEPALAEARGLEARERFPRGSAGWFRSLYQAIFASSKLGNFDRVERGFAEARGVVAAGDARGAQILCLCACASELVLGGRYAAADAALAEIEPLTPPDPLSLALAHQSRSIRASARGDSVACLEGLSAALSAFEQAEDRRNAAMTRCNLGFVLAELGDFEGAEEALRAALITADRMGLHEVAAGARNNLGYALCCRGQLDEARGLLRQSIETFQRQGAPRNEGLARTYLAEVELRAGDALAAEREARAAAEVLAGIPSLHAVASAVLALCLLGRGLPAEALEAASAGHAQLCALGSIEEGEALVRLAYAEALAAAGGEAATALAEARDHLLARAARINDPVWRDRFLAGVPENARTLSLAAKI